MANITTISMINELGFNDYSLWGGSEDIASMVFDIVNTKEFNRLWNIRQHGWFRKGFVRDGKEFKTPEEIDHFSYTRAQHSIQVASNALRMMLSYFPESNHVAQKHVVAAALLHDIGHLHLSHTTDIILESLTDDTNIYCHECRGVNIIKASVPIKEILKTNYLTVSTIVDLIRGKSKKPFGFIVNKASKKYSLDADCLSYMFEDRKLLLDGGRVSEIICIDNIINNTFSSPLDMAAQVISLLNFREELRDKVYIGNEEKKAMVLALKSAALHAACKKRNIFQAVRGADRFGIRDEALKDLFALTENQLRRELRCLEVGGRK